MKERTHCLSGHEFTADTVYYRKDGKGRVCKVCQNERSNDWKRRHPYVKKGRRAPFNEGHLPALIVDYLFIDSGWLTAAGIALALGALPETVDRSLYRLRKMGFVTSRQVGLARNERGHTEVRVEWSALDHIPTLF